MLRTLSSSPLPPALIGLSASAPCLGGVPRSHSCGAKLAPPPASAFLRPTAPARPVFASVSKAGVPNLDRDVAEESSTDESDDSDDGAAPTTLPVLDPRAFAAAIDLAAAGGAATAAAPTTPAPISTTPRLLSLPDTDTDAEAAAHLATVAAALLAAATPAEQLAVSCGLPLTQCPATKRFSLAPTAALVLRLSATVMHRPPPKLDLSTSTLFARRTAAAAAAKRAQGSN